MSLDEQVVELLRDRFDRIDHTLGEMRDTFKTHADKDEVYWKKIDQQDGQITVIKWLFSGVSGSAILAWLYTNFGR